MGIKQRDDITDPFLGRFKKCKEWNPRRVMPMETPKVKSAYEIKQDQDDRKIFTLGAMIGILSSGNVPIEPEYIARSAVKMADAIMEALKK